MVIEGFDGLLVDYVRKKKAVAIIRGLRAVSDFEYEMQMALMNRRLDNTIETVFMMPNEDYSFITSTIVKEAASYGGDVSSLVPGIVVQKLKKKFGKWGKSNTSIFIQVALLTVLAMFPDSTAQGTF